MKGAVEPQESNLDWIAEDLRGLALELGDLTQDPANARLHPERNMEALKASLHRFGQRKPVVVRREGMIVIAGNGTLAAAKALGWSHVAAVIVEDDATTATGYAIADNRTAELAEWDVKALNALMNSIQGSIGPSELGFEPDDLAALLGGVDLPEEDEKYTRKIESPVYEPTGDKPPVGKLYDNKKAARLIGEIVNADLPDEVRKFLIASAMRHTVFDYGQIANFYAHSGRRSRA